MRKHREVTTLRPSRYARLARRALCLCAVATPLGACGVDRTIVSTLPPEDYRARHPIVLTQSPVVTEIFASGPHLDVSARDRVTSLVREARSANPNVAQFEVLFPQGSANDAHQRAALPAIRQALSSAGAHGYVSVGGYPALDPTQAAPIRISYTTLRAKVATQCGQWPTDLASGGSVTSWDNRPYYNMGCANQSFVAAQVANPSDLVEPRAIANGDVEMRIRAIGKVRQGADPGTIWTTKNTSIGNVGGN